MSPAASDLDAYPGRPLRAVLGLGANLGDRVATLHAAVDDLDGFEGIRVVAVSAPVETTPVGGPPQPDYLNAVALVDTTLSPLGLLAACQQVEADHGRVRAVRWGPRTLDIDLLCYSDLVVDTPQLQLPHPRAGQRAFVLSPWLEVDPQASLPGPAGAVPVVRLLAEAADRDGVRPRPDLRVWAGG